MDGKKLKEEMISVIVSDEARAEVLKAYIVESEKTEREKLMRSSEKSANLYKNDGFWLAIVIVAFLLACVAGGVTCAWHDVAMVRSGAQPSPAPSASASAPK